METNSGIDKPLQMRQCSCFFSFKHTLICGVPQHFLLHVFICSGSKPFFFFFSKCSWLLNRKAPKCLERTEKSIAYTCKVVRHFSEKKIKRVLRRGPVDTTTSHSEVAAPGTGSPIDPSVGQLVSLVVCHVSQSLSQQGFAGFRCARL